MKNLHPASKNTLADTAAETASDATVWLEEVRGLISDGHIVEFTPKGYSMWPTIRPETDTVCIEASATYNLSDIVLAFSNNPYGVFLHRITAVCPDGFLLRGDSNLYQTERCHFRDIVGKITAVRRNGRDITGSTWQRVHTRLQNLPRFFRHPFVRAVKLYLNFKYRTDEK